MTERSPEMKRLDDMGEPEVRRRFALRQFGDRYEASHLTAQLWLEEWDRNRTLLGAAIETEAQAARDAVAARSADASERSSVAAEDAAKEARVASAAATRAADAAERQAAASAIQAAASERQAAEAKR